MPTVRERAGPARPEAAPCGPAALDPVARRASSPAPRRASRSGPTARGAALGDAAPRDSAAAYDVIAGFYERYWSGGLSARLWAIAAPLLLPRVAPGGHVLDVGCGTGVAAAALLAAGFRVTGVDASPAMLAHARRRAPRARFVAADLRRARLPGAAFDGAVALGEVVNHLLTPHDLARALGGVARALRPGAAFVFDVVTEAAFVAHWWGQTYETREADAAFAACGTYDATTRLARMQVEVARPTGPAADAAWQAEEHTLLQRCHAPGELDAAVRRAGFAPEYVDAAADLGLADQAGRVFVVAVRQDALGCRP